LTLFDGYLIVDWSANATPKRGKDSIWIAFASASGDPVELSNPATRSEACAAIIEHLDRATKRGKRLFAGFDFPFGYPKGTARALCGQDDWRAVWALLARMIEDDAENGNNRFAVASALNATWTAEGPFWGHPWQHKDRYTNLLPKKPDGYGEALPPQRRQAEKEAKGAQETWKLYGAGSVGGQALTGIAALERIRHATGAKVWPFEALGEARAHVLAEIYPSLVPAHPGEKIKDAGQVRAFAKVVSTLDANGDLAEVLSYPARLNDAIRMEEGWILGLGQQAMLNAIQPSIPNTP